MNRDIDTIAQTPLFGGLSSDQLYQISQIIQDKTFQKGETIFLEGDEGVGFYIVAQGKVKIFKLSAEGKEQILHIYGPGHPFGEVPVFAGHSYPANAQAIGQSRLLFLPRQAFIQLITEHPSLCLNMLAVLSMRLREFTIQIENLSLKEVPGRLASYLRYLAEEQNNSTQIRLPISKGQLASLLGTIPETLSRIFKKMTTQGFIHVNGAHIVMKDPAGLEELSLTGRLE